MQKVSISQTVKSLRNKAGFTQDQLTEKVSFSKRTLADYEGGDSIPPMDKFIEIAIACRMSHQDLICLLTGEYAELEYRPTRDEELIATQRQALSLSTDKIRDLERELEEHRKENCNK